MGSNDGSGRRDRWARLRFAAVGPHLASPPPAGRLRAELERLAERQWDRPSGKVPVRFAVSTIERRNYAARTAGDDPVGALKRRRRTDAGRPRAMPPAPKQETTPPSKATAARDRSPGVLAPVAAPPPRGMTQVARTQ